MRDRFFNGCKFRVVEDRLDITLSKISEIDTDFINDLVRTNNLKSISFNNIVSVKNIKSLLEGVKNLYVQGKILIDFNRYINTDPDKIGVYRPLIEGLNNKVYIDLNNKPSNVEIRAFSSDHDQNEFTTWVHNLNDANKTRIYRLLSEEDKEYYIEEELVLKNFYIDILKKYPRIKYLSKKEQFDLIFDYVLKEYPYASECTLPNGHIRPDCHYAQDPVETYKNKRGVCAGRAGLLTLVTNNNLFRLNCTTAIGMCGKLQHVWNIYVDDQGRASDYDLSFGIKDETKTNMIERGYKYKRIYDSVKERVHPALPPRTIFNNIGAVPIKPLPPRKRKYTLNNKGQINQ